MISGLRGACALLLLLLPMLLPPWLLLLLPSASGARCSHTASTSWLMARSWPTTCAGRKAATLEQASGTNRVVPGG